MVIIFDLGGVLFEWDREDLLWALGGKDIDPYRPINSGINLLNRYAKNKNIKIYVVSNWLQPTLDLLWKYHKPTLELFDGIVVPSVAGHSKPDSRIFTYFLNEYKHFPQECIFIDDVAENVNVACSLGIKGIVCDDYARVQQAIDKEISILVENE